MCRQDEFLDSNGQCTPCDSNCDGGCQDATGHCNRCKDGRVLKNGVCECPASFVKTVDGQCVCPEGLKVNATGECVIVCQTGQFLWQAECFDCYEGCEQCEDDSGKCNTCKAGFDIDTFGNCQCPAGFRYESSNDSCVEDRCQDGEYRKDGVCTACGANCEQCED